MATTRELPAQEWHRYFDEVTKRQLRDAPDVVTVELLSDSLGDQTEIEGAPLAGVTWDGAVLELLFDDVDHLELHPQRLSVVEEDDGFVSALEIVRDDGDKEIVRLHRAR